MCRVHFSRAVLFCQPHQQLFTDSYRETEPSCSNAESDSLPLRAWILLPLLPEASASRKTVFIDKNFPLMVLGGWNGGRPSEVTLHLSMLLPENISDHSRAPVCASNSPPSPPPPSPPPPPPPPPRNCSIEWGTPPLDWPTGSRERNNAASSTCRVVGGGGGWGWVGGGGGVSGRWGGGAREVVVYEMDEPQNACYSKCLE